MLTFGIVSLFGRQIFCAAVGWGSEFVGWKFRYRLQADSCCCSWWYTLTLPEESGKVEAMMHYMHFKSKMSSWPFPKATRTCEFPSVPRQVRHEITAAIAQHFNLGLPRSSEAIDGWRGGGLTQQVEVWPNRFRFDPRFLWYVFNICGIHPGTIVSTIVPWSRCTVFHLIIQYFMNWNIGSQDSIWH